MSASPIIRQLHELLAPLGFERKKGMWNRQSAAKTDVIDLQVSKAGDAVTVNAGVMDPEVYTRCWGTDPPKLVDEASCTVRTRIGQLMGDTDVWWPIGDVDTPNAVAEAVAEKVLPFLERMHGREAMLEFLDGADTLRQKYPPPIIYLAILKDDAGDKAGACSLLAELHTTALGAWPARVSEVAERLGCS